MFWRIFSIKFKELIRNRSLTGWNFIFPMILATAFYLGFGNMIHEDPDLFTSIPCGYVQNQTQQSRATDAISFEQVLLSLDPTAAENPAASMTDATASSGTEAEPGNTDETNTDNTKKTSAKNNNAESDDEQNLISLTTYSSVREADKALKKGTIDGYYEEKDGEILLTVRENGKSSTILNQIRKEYANKKQTVINLMKENPAKLTEVMDLLTKDSSFLQPYRFGEQTSAYMQYFFALLAMVALYGSTFSTEMLRGMCANLSELGKRYECTPVRKLSSVFAGSLACLVIQSIGSFLIVLYIQYVLGLPFGAPLPAVMLVIILGDAVGIALGMLVGAVCKNESLLWIIPLGIAMTCSFLSGLMLGNLKQLIEQSCPIINKLNPAALVTDALYVASAYGFTRAFYIDLLILASMFIITIIGSSLLLRRRKYASI